MSDPPGGRADRGGSAEPVRSALPIDTGRSQRNEKERSDLSADSPGSWINRGDTEIYHCPWLQLVTSDVLLPDGTQIDHHVVRLPRPAAGTIIVADDQVLLLYRHRFITDTWGWEIPAGAVDAGETSAQAAMRESREETGWRPLHVTPVCTFYPANGVLDQAFHIFISHDAEHQGAPTDTNEAVQVSWHPVPKVREMLASGLISDGLSFGGLAFAFATGTLGAHG